MSVAHRQVGLGSSSAASRPVAPQALTDVTIRWRVAADALASGTRGTCTLEVHAWREERGQVLIEAALVTPTERRIVQAAGQAASPDWWTDDAGLDHIEAGTTLRTTLRRTPQDEVEILFAQTDLFVKLGVAGGRYDRPS